MTAAEIRAEGRRLHKIAEEAGALGERGAASTFKRHLGEFVFNNAAVLLAEPGEQEVDLDKCACGKLTLDSFIGTYSDASASHTRVACTPHLPPVPAVSGESAEVEDSYKFASRLHQGSITGATTHEHRWYLIRHRDAAMRAQGRREGEAAGFSRGIEEAALGCDKFAYRMRAEMTNREALGRSSMIPGYKCDAANTLGDAIRALAASTAQGEEWGGFSR